MVMVRAQTLVQLSDDLLTALDQRAASRGVSRSRIIRDAIEQHLAEDLDAEVTRSIVEGYRRQPQAMDDAWGDPLEWADRSAREVHHRLSVEEHESGHPSW